MPDSRRPPLPRLAGSVDPVTGEATLAVTGDGFDGVALRRDEPGLFDPEVGAAVAPWFRMRRAVGAVADPIYGREVAHGTLARDASADPDVVFTGTVVDDNDGRGLAPFVRYVYWAEVRLPPERRLPVGVVPIDAGFDALDPANAADYPRPMSLPSAPRTLMRMPSEPPAAPEQASITATHSALAGGGAEVTIEIADPPQASQLAIGPYRLAVWTQWRGQPIRAITDVGGAPLDGIWPDLSDGAVTFTVAPPAAPGDPNDPINVRLAYIDPAGRLGAMTTVSVA